MSTAPSLRVERRLLREGVATLAAADEVGRGALCGPVTIGMVLIDAATRSAPTGVRDSKLLTPAARERLVPRIQRWAISYGVGHASPVEIDEFGITAALRLAGQRALAQLSDEAGVVLLDGNHDYLSEPEQEALFGSPTPAVVAVPPVVTMIKADMKCAAVAAASVLAKTARDALLLELAEAHPEYGWAENKGYSAPEHLAALLEHGPTPQHRLSWRLPGCDVIDPVAFRRAAAIGVPAGVQNGAEPSQEESR
ncbi:ribonuclease HII [Nocardioides jiangxiensis]|uniref:Ribonuclease HII n=1 Tax=Nocardioides jiangxiensis TaxID=3064524 RepID=A0ABT9B2X9_9ACTN|nr:ribonuclease HII [Nocardioides sp. WY-20]MDO7869196.1 ribonuclease HII [Nocardioides sp. WY-20]